MIKIIIVDDHQLFRDGLKALVSTQEDFQILQSLGTGEELMHALSTGPLPDIVLLDLTMPEMDGFEILKQVRGKFPTVRFIVISMLDDGLYVSKCVRSGAHGYLLKNTDNEELFTAIRSVSTGEKYFNNEIKELMIQNLALEGSDLRPLSNRESEVLFHVGQGKTTKEIASILFVSVRTVETHRVNMMRKLEVQNTAELIRKAIELKLI